MSGFKLAVWADAAILSKADGLLAEAVTETVANAALVAQTKAPVDTGFLKNSITFDPAKREGRGFIGRLRANANYSLWVELGTRRTRAQPFLRPAADAEFPKLLDRIRGRLR